MDVKYGRVTTPSELKVCTIHPGYRFLSSYDNLLRSFLRHMNHLPNELLLMTFEHFLQPLVTAYDTATANGMPLGEQVRLFKNLVSCKLVCRRWKEVAEKYPSLFYRDAHNVTDDSLASRSGLRVKGKYVKRLIVGEFDRVGSTSDRILDFFPNVAYLSWTCRISWDEYYRARKFAYSPLKQLRRLDWRFCGHLVTSVKSFIKLAQHSPVLQYITLTMSEMPLKGRKWQIRFDVPDSVTTVGVFLRPSAWPLGWWIRNQWFTGPVASFNHVITSGSFRPGCVFSKIELRPDPYSTTQPAESALQTFLKDRLPQDDDTRGTLIYSCTTYAPPDCNNLVLPKRVGWVDNIILKTSGSSHRTEVEIWNTVQQHLDFILKQFQNLRSVDLCDDFLKWREDEMKGKVLEAFEISAHEFGIAIGYIKQNP